MSELGKYLKEKRIAAGLKQKDVSDKLGYGSAQFIANFEAGKSHPTAVSLMTLSNLYGVPVNELLEKIQEFIAENAKKRFQKSFEASVI